MMTNESAYDLWAPPALPWSKWVKPVLFAHMKSSDPVLPVRPVELPWLAGITERAALVIDVPSALGVAIGLGLAERGYQPVPLYNAVPGPSAPAAVLSTAQPHCIVDARSIMEALRGGAERLQQVRLATNCAPAFLLDYRRHSGDGLAMDGRFDNRSVSFPTDFPPATFLREQNIRQAVLIQAEGLQPQPDLAHTLLYWQDEGIAISAVSLECSEPPVPIHILRPSYFRSIWHSLLESIGFLRRNKLGGLDGLLPEASAG